MPNLQTKCQMNLTMSLFQDIPIFDGQGTTRLDDWLSDIKTAAAILKESHACLAKAKSCGLTNRLICKSFKLGGAGMILEI